MRQAGGWAEACYLSTHRGDLAELKTLLLDAIPDSDSLTEVCTKNTTRLSAHLPFFARVPEDLKGRDQCAGPKRRARGKHRPSRAFRA